MKRALKPKKPTTKAPYTVSLKVQPNEEGTETPAADESLLQRRASQSPAQ